jgi:dihydrofolate synthase/folylpolyglutamate synthase
LSRFSTLDHALAWLDEHIDYESVAPTRRDLPSLEGMYAALAILGEPQRDIRSIHVTGTNGKGSTTAMIAGLLLEAGLRVGTYTSPNVHLVNERITVNGELIPDKTLCELLGRLADAESMFPVVLTRFELLTLAALVHFADEAVDVAVVEVGIGGTWDSTNVIGAEVAVITTIALDHMQVLGDTPAAIARDKAGIISPGSIVVIGDVDEELAGIISEVAEGAVAERVASFGIDFGLRANTLAVGGRLVDIYDAEASYSEVMVPLHGPHQGRNAAIAVAAANAFLGFSLGEEVIDAGMDGVRVPGRLEVLGRKPLVIVDGAHNPAGAQVLAEALIEGFQVEGSRIALIGMLEGRDPVALLEPLTIAGFTTFFVVQPASPRAMELQRVDEAARSLGATATPYLDLWEACDDALTAVGENGMVLATGSLYVVGPARLALREIITKR